MTSCVTLSTPSCRIPKRYAKRCAMPIRKWPARAGGPIGAAGLSGGHGEHRQERPLVYHALKEGQVASEIACAIANRYLAEPDDIQTVIHDQIGICASTVVSIWSWITVWMSSGSAR